MSRRRVAEVFLLTGLCSAVPFWGGCASKDGESPNSGGTDAGWSGDGSIEWRLCEVAKGCGMLKDEVSVQDCTEDYQSCTAEMSASEKARWDDEARACISMLLCDDFIDCFWSVGYCDDDNEPTGAPPGPPCASVGEECETNEDCCHYSEPDPTVECADYGGAYGLVCGATCEENPDCPSNCCATLESGQSMCAPAELCE